MHRLLLSLTLIILAASLAYLWQDSVVRIDLTQDDSPVVELEPIETQLPTTTAEQGLLTPTTTTQVETPATPVSPPPPPVTEQVPPESVAQEPEPAPPPPEPIAIEAEPIVERSFRDINVETREALVNIFCLTRGYNAQITPISGSGVFIDSRGVILTNAHIAQYFLLRDYPIEGFVRCLIRTGSPAKAQYSATLLYISPPWINENSTAITDAAPIGTGEHDFAFLLIDDTLDESELPETFPALPYTTADVPIAKGDEILVGAYPAGFLGSRTIQDSLYASTAVTTAAEFYTFDQTDGFLDVISLGGTVVAQEGSSGGAVVTDLGELMGIVSTSAWGETTADRDLRAITLAHIERSLIEHNKTTIAELLLGDLNAKATAFNETAAPTLLQILISSFLAN